ncbi:ABC transporter ATP-binding protein [Opitutus sp. ER46]|uniref:ABC transporter ATP-binding protein n=1 Tax=Opitutus sp. ER46 TaxID=2161864 RepID=UPI000D31EFC7|nr:ABC transporter ATP-binding protein [Opitutus sp. ER46]PTY00344.1 ABC transporter ATP-binding protein [Opitutus sp. ER46]
MNIIETHGLTRRFGRTEAVHGLDLEVPAGSVFALLGPNGAGKTTTIKLMLDLLRPTHGSATVLGVDSRRLGEREKAQIGYVSENQELPLWMTVRQLLDYCRPFYPTWDRDLEKALLAQFALPEERKLKHLSRGMLMKAALLSSLAYRPKLLVLDEPFSGLDPLVRDEFIRGVLEVSTQGEWTVFVSSHDIDEVERLADRVAMIEAGRLRLAETTEALQQRFRQVEVSLDDGTADLANVPATWLEVERSGSLVRFVASDYERAATEQACRERFPRASVVAKPMTLREIFLVLARAGRAAAGQEVGR